MKRAILVIMLVLLQILCASVAFADASSVREVRVGIVQPDIPSPVFNRAEPYIRGYIQSYLTEIDKQTRWHYTYVHATPQECYEKLKRGELDLIAPIHEEFKDYPDLIYTESYAAYTLLNFYKNKENTALSVENHDSMQNIRVGLVAGSEIVDGGTAMYMKDQEWLGATIREFDGFEPMVAALRAGEIDALLDDGNHVDGAHEAWLDTINIYSAQFATTPDKADLINELKLAILVSEVTNPRFESNLDSRYVNPIIGALSRLSTRQKQYVESAPTLRILIPPDVEGWFSHASSDKRGFFLDVLEILSQKVSLQFETIPQKSIDDTLSQLTKNEADLAFVVFGNKNPHVPLAFTSDILEEFFVILHPAKQPFTPQPRSIAVPRILLGLTEYIKLRYPESNIISAKDVDEAVMLVETMKADTAMIPQTTAERMMLLSKHPQLTYEESQHITVPISMAIAPNLPDELRTTLNMGILWIPNEEYVRLAIENAQPDLSLYQFVKKNPSISLQVGVLLLMVVLIISAAFLYIRFHEWASGVIHSKNEELHEAMSTLSSMGKSLNQYRNEATHDMLTMLLNKQGFRSEVEHALKNHPKTVQSMFVIDLDNFKSVNDIAGHQSGDAVLVEFSTQLKRIFRNQDFVGRFGGDEFVVCLPVADPLLLEKKAEGILEAAAKIRVPDYPQLRVGASIGIAQYPAHGECYEELFHCADYAVYRAKEAGKNCYRMYGEE